MPHWSAEDIAWQNFDPSKLDPNLLQLVKSASLTEFNAAQYTQYLKNVFQDDRELHDALAEWQREEQQHGRMLARYAEMADPSFNFEAAFAAFTAGYHFPADSLESVRGSRVGELVARCIVETGTSSYYSALSEATEEPVLKQLARHIAADEFRHYRFFFDGMERYRQRHPISLLTRLKIVISRIRETEDDELAFAFHCANEKGVDYDRQRCLKAYSRVAYNNYRRHHAEQVVRMSFRAIGLPPRGWLADLVSGWAFRKMQSHVTA